MSETIPGFEDTKYVPKRVGEQVVQCPVCGATTSMELYQHDVPVVGRILIVVMNCQSCGYRYREAFPLQYVGKPIRIRVRVEGKDDLSTLIYKSSSAFIRIPELGIEISPGPANTDEITTVDGLLLHISENLFPLCDDLDDPQKCYDVTSKLVQAANGDLAITIEIIDPSGLSSVLRGSTNKYVVEFIDEKEIPKPSDIGVTIKSE